MSERDRESRDSGPQRVALSLACGEPLAVHRFSIREAISSPFEIRVLARSPDPCLDYGTIVPRPAALRLVSGTRHALRERRWAGVCRHIHQMGALSRADGEARLFMYELLLTPRLSRLTERINRRVFQHQSAPEIARTLLAEWALPAAWHIDEAEHPRLVYKVQYRESDVAFLSRLLEEAGLAYTFVDDGGPDPRLVLSDAPARTGPRREAPIGHIDEPSMAGEREFVTAVDVAEEDRGEAVTLRDHDFQRPAWPLLGKAERGPAEEEDGEVQLERFSYRPGAFLVERAEGAVHDAAHGARLATRELEAERTGHCLITFETNAIDLAPGVVFAIEGHPRPELDPRLGLLVTELSIDGTPEGAWTIRAAAVPASEPYRPPRCTPKPQVSSVQTAVVVGPPGQEMYTDAHGRVRVQFRWDREGALDERSSCWLRVSQGWAGAGFGMFALPRVGQEVLVGFDDGDPDQPIIVGRVCNALNPAPLRLPAEQTQSVWRSASSPGGEGYNEIRFDDRKGNELVAMRAERDRRTSVGLDEALSVGRHRTTVIGGDESARIDGKLVMYVGEDGHLTFGGALRERIGGTRSLTVEGDQHAEVGGDAAMEAGRAIHVRAGTKLVLEGGDVTLRGPGGFIRIDASGVTINGATVRIQEGGAAPGEGCGAHPELPVVPPGVPPPPPPRRLPLFEFPDIPRRRWPGRGAPLNEDERFLCTLLCQCIDTPLPQRCVEQKLRALDQSSGGLSPYKPEVPYDMSKRPPAPIMSKNEPWRPTRSRPAGSKIPDVVVLKDPTKPPTQDNIKEVVEMKFEDPLPREQLDNYRIIAGDADVRVLDPVDCGCPERKEEAEPEPMTAEEEAAEALLLTVFVIAMVLDDALPGGQADDVLIAPALARLAPTLTRLMTKLLPRLGPLVRPVPMIP